jgi:tRNA threonylcarbamoyladenosine biosynthesis protein TsaB
MRTRILAVDTTSDFGSLALCEDGRTVEEELLHSADGFGHILFGRVRALLERNGWPLESIHCYAAAAGPGSFTGVRVGLSAIKGMAETLGRGVLAVSNLQAIASFGTSPLRAAFFDARRGEVYGAVYDAGGAMVEAEIVAPFPEWLRGLPARVEFVTPDPAVFAAALPAEARVTTSPRAIAAAVARIAAREFEAGNAPDPVAIDANYVRRSDAELFWMDSPLR